MPTSAQYATISVCPCGNAKDLVFYPGRPDNLSTDTETTSPQRVPSPQHAPMCVCPCVIAKDLVSYPGRPEY